MCDSPSRTYDNTAKQATRGESYGNKLDIGSFTESHTVYELKQRREYLLRQLLDIQNAIDAVNRLG